jgi:DNA-binding GntR family transcriptional regulator
VQLYYRDKTSEAVAEYLIRLIFEGTLRGGDRIDRDEVAAALGVSRAPVQEALVRLERSGVVEMPYHRAAHVTRFDGQTVREDFESYGLLMGLATSRVAVNRSSEVLARLERIRDEICTTDNVESFRELVREFNLAVYDAGASPRLKAALNDSIIYLRNRPSTAFFTLQEYARPALRVIICKMFDAIRECDADGAKAASIELTSFHCDLVLRELAESQILYGKAGVVLVERYAVRSI